MINLNHAQKLANTGMSVKDIARALGVTPEAIYSRVRNGSLRAAVKQHPSAAPRPTGPRKPLRFRIDLDRAQALLDKNLTTAEIAAAMQCSRNGIQKLIREGKIRRRTPASPGPRPLSQPVPFPAPVSRAVPPVRPAPPIVQAPRLSQLIATGGRYADLEAWARAWKVTGTQARLEWHRLGLPLQARRA